MIYEVRVTKQARKASDKSGKKARKIAVSKKHVPQRHRVWLNPAAIQTVGRIKARYIGLLGRGVTFSVIVRRALEALDRELEGVTDPKEEAAKLIEHIGWRA